MIASQDPRSEGRDVGVVRDAVSDALWVLGRNVGRLGDLLGRLRDAIAWLGFRVWDLSNLVGGYPAAAPPTPLHNPEETR
ncbi:hypothetical protein LV457_02715 [Mycobacterium sp. MYCO198283]|uniref:hypothetical protein n=1 Tax=Mycobacterium sp. MYCO198283 TaxID=2883505 RepID=UPI001E5AE844|nr:hypothetical protein [Mycobacterium sp. MYCO198283]MCG5431202.1 hypothetical protein [Mycobacterium sp. MYCO198283]